MTFDTKTWVNGIGQANARLNDDSMNDLEDRIESAFVDEQAADTFTPIFYRTAASRPAGNKTGFWTGMTTFNGTVDPFVSMGYIGGAGEVSSTFALEGDWDVGAHNVTEMYWQIIKTDGTTSRRPMFGMYNRTTQRTHGWWFMIGDGEDNTGANPGGFNVNWDDDTSQVGINCFSVTPNRINLYGVSNGGVAATETRLCLFSATGQGSALSLTYNGQDAEGVVHPTWLLQTTGAAQANFRVGGTYAGEWHAPSATSPGLRLQSGIQLGSGANMRSAIYSSSGVPDNAMGANGDLAIRQDTPGTVNQRLYFKAAGAWVALAV